MTTKTKRLPKEQTRPVSYAGTGLFERKMEKPVKDALLDLQYRVEKALHVAEGLPYQSSKYAEPIIRKMARILVGHRNIWPLAAAPLHGPIRISYIDNDRMNTLIKSMKGLAPEELQRRIVLALEIARDSNDYAFYTDSCYFIDQIVHALAGSEYDTALSGARDWRVGYKPKKYRSPKVPAARK